MAKLKNLDKIWSAKVDEPVKVGNNRTITRLDADSPLFVCRLHGNTVALVRPHMNLLQLHAQEWLTTTTIAAMNDFMKAFNIRGKASRAGGELSLRVMHDGEWKTVVGDPAITTKYGSGTNG